MTMYYSERTFQKETTDHLRKMFPRGEINSNFFTIRRADNIDDHLFLVHFDCAVAKYKDLYKAKISLPIDLEDRIPFWFVRSDNTLWVDPKSGPRGKNIHNQNVFGVEFHLYIDEKKIHSFDETKDLSPEEALIREFIEIRHALIDRNEEPIDIFRGIYIEQQINIPKFKVVLVEV